MHRWPLALSPIRCPRRYNAAVSETPVQPEPAESDDQSLAPLRAKIDELDQQLIKLLNERAKVVVEVGKVKRAGNTPIYVPDREKRVLEQVRSYNKGPLPDKCIEAIYRELMSGSFAASDEAIAALPASLAAISAAREVDAVAIRSMLGNWLESQLRHCANAWGCE